MDIRKLYVKMNEVDMNTGRIILPTSSELARMSGGKRPANAPPRPEPVADDFASVEATVSAPPKPADLAAGEAPSSPPEAAERASTPPRYIQASPDIPSLTLPEEKNAPTIAPPEQDSLPQRAETHTPEPPMPSTRPALLALVASAFFFLLIPLVGLCAYLFARNEALGNQLQAAENKTPLQPAAAPAVLETDALNQQISLLRTDLQKLNATMASISFSLTEEPEEVVEYYEEVDPPALAPQTNSPVDSE